jgi:hypothetical protein
MTFVNYLNRFLRSGDRVVMVVKDGINWDMNSFLYLCLPPIKLFIINGEGVVFKTRFKAKYFSKALRWLSTFWYCIRCCRYCESSWEMTLSINFLLVSLLQQSNPICRRNDYQGNKTDMVWKFVVSFAIAL